MGDESSDKMGDAVDALLRHLDDPAEPGPKPIRAKAQGDVVINQDVDGTSTATFFPADQ
ncbi:hypothetical protein [Mycobacterium sp. URHB0044]|uniref:hypothetical protein n=1 Tax=Mycobacterium sp. URHB0044 TaxID=1380386 RepID=UPI000AD5D347|nr:hypothetical protein [Mycobacterium sp. URHB0044]